MAKKYPEDEFDRLPPTGRRGAHRQESAIGQRGAYVLIGIVALIAVLLVVGVINIIRTSFVDPEAQVQDPPAAESSEDPESPAPEETSAEVDRESVVVAVFNSSGVSGAGAKFAEATEATGWVVDEVGNYSSPDSTSTVYYTLPEHEVQAAALADELGIENIEESQEFSADLTVVIASDIAEQGPPASGDSEAGAGDDEAGALADGAQG